MPVPSEFYHVCRMPVSCPNCDWEAFELISQLAKMQTITCQKCQTEMDLMADPVRAEIHSFADYCRGRMAPVAQPKA